MFRDHLLAQVAARPFGEQRVLAEQFDAGLEVRRRLPVLADTHVAGRHAADRAVAVVEHFGGGEAREDLDAEFFRLRSQPTHDIGQADDVVAVVDEAVRQQPVRVRVRLVLGQEVETVLGHRRVERRTALLPVGDELVDRPRVHDRARQDVRAELGALLEDDDAHVLPGLRSALLDADCRREARRTAADDDDVVLHGFAFDGGDGIGSSGHGNGATPRMAMMNCGTAPPGARARGHGPSLPPSPGVSARWETTNAARDRLSQGARPAFRLAGRAGQGRPR